MVELGSSFELCFCFITLTRVMRVMVAVGRRVLIHFSEIVRRSTCLVLPTVFLIPRLIISFQGSAEATDKVDRRPLGSCEPDSICLKYIKRSSFLFLSLRYQLSYFYPTHVRKSHRWPEFRQKYKCDISDWSVVGWRGGFTGEV